ncbi:Epidermal patterning factor-like protein [Quillaja saponaria]|uniref:Epidermal patterning factor-like protein n=1 Tax=Quillaja saponaria TaxID=32244 RepID=A0AAD7VKJ8_QUISA|nr:Epidermal patterning factor-like protein [Quillaja saponaria]
MDSPPKYPNGFKISVILMLTIFTTFFPSNSVGSSKLLRDTNGLEHKKLVLGSRPPRCVNKCMSCRPCNAALVIPHHRDGLMASGDRDESYYLLSWKCKCGDKIYQP